MSVEALIISLTLLAITGLWIAAPFFDKSRQQAAESTQKQRDRLLLHYERALGNIRDLDEDYATGKIQPESYAAEREQWVQRGIQILMALDEVSAKQAPVASKSSTADVERSIDNRIEAAVQAHRQAAKTHQ